MIEKMSLLVISSYHIGMPLIPRHAVDFLYKYLYSISSILNVILRMVILYNYLNFSHRYNIMIQTIYYILCALKM